jgi:hypothetical protein
LKLEADKKYKIQIKAVEDERPWNRIKNAIKDLFPLDWTEEMIAEAFVKTEEKIKYVLTKEV